MSPALAPAPACRYYGRSHAILRMFGELVNQRGNECAVVFDSYSPCKMETLGYQPDETRCPRACTYQRIAPPPEAA